MINNNAENAFEARFGLKKMPQSKVAEISQATAESSCPIEERINLHIGNPVQDPRLDQLYTTLVFGDAIGNSKGLNWDGHKQKILKSTSNPTRQKIMKLIFETIEKANPYTPRGGFNPKKPGTLIRMLHAWLTVGQEVPLDYSIGESGSLPEIAITSGGKNETLKLILQVIENNLKGPNKNIISLEKPLSQSKTRAYFGKIFTIQGTENHLLQQINVLIENSTHEIGFILFQKIYSKEFRVNLAALAAHNNLMLLEANDASNAYSLARSPGMAQRLLRIITSKAIDPRLSNSALAFVLGNANFIEALNLIHFQKKGTPSATEIKLLSFLLDEKECFNQTLRKNLVPEKKAGSDQADQSTRPDHFMSQNKALFSNLTIFQPLIEKLSSRVETVAKKGAHRIETLNSTWSKRLDNFNYTFYKNKRSDTFGGKSVWEVITSFFANLKHPEYVAQLQEAFLAQFAKVHPEFEPEHTFALNGSARAALSSAAEVWGITEAIIPDLSWTYGDAIEKVSAVPLNDDLTISAANIIRTVSAKLDRDKQWYQYGCIVLNNPHNATGKITPEKEIEKILAYCLAHRIRVIDDLSYANMVVANPSERQKIGPVKNCRILANQLIDRGFLAADSIRYLVTIRSISKTDCKAGARLCVLEIPDTSLRERFKSIISEVEPNRMALLLSYLFYRNGIDKLNEYWYLRDSILWERMQALAMGLAEIPASDNLYRICLVSPRGAMYPHLVVQNLPENVNVDDLSTNLATKGIGLVPMTTFAHTESSYAYATRCFRLTLGGPASNHQLKQQIGCLVAELTQEIKRHAYNYTLYSPAQSMRFSFQADQTSINKYLSDCEIQFLKYWEKIEKFATNALNSDESKWLRDKHDINQIKAEFISSFLSSRKAVFRSKLRDHAILLGNLRENFSNIQLQQHLVEKFKREVDTETEANRREQFQQRLFDRTVHPTQCYSIQVEKLFSKLIESILKDDVNAFPDPKKLFTELQREYLAENIAIKSEQEAEEAILDLDMLAMVEDFSDYFYSTDLDLILSLWGDWDGSRRPSGQGHNLVAGALITNVLRLTDLTRFLEKEGLLNETQRAILFNIGNIEQKIKKFLKILKKITELTTELEARYRKHLEFVDRPNWLIRKLRKLKLARDPVQVMWKHNDRNERRMQSYRRQRSSEILRFFKMNHQLSRLMQTLMSRIAQNSHRAQLLERLVNYKNPLKRFYLTPRIHQKIITSSDSFAIDTTVYNLVEINKMGVMFGYPGLVLSLQVSMTNRADAIISLDKKLREQWERVIRENPSIKPVHIRIVPLFEEIEILQNIEAFLDKIWEYAEESKVLGQTAPDRFCEIIGEFFIAGSDLSQQVSQSQALLLFKEAKARINTYLLKKGLAGRLRIKFGTGEPGQRQAGYYDAHAAQRVLQLSDTSSIVEQLQIDGFAAEALIRARSPLNGIFSTSDFRTLQSNIMEKLRQLSAPKLVETFYHIKAVQTDYKQQIKSFSETYWGSRRRLQQEMLSQLNVLMKGQLTPAYLEFTKLVQKNFTHILYGNSEDMAGIHVISYFISRALLSVRDRPTVRPTKETGENRGRQIVEHLSGTLPLSEHGTLLRAIGHNKAQTMILGINQLSTGFFRSMREFIGHGKNMDEQIFKLRQEVLPHLPVKDILNSLRLYHEPGLSFLKRLESAFPPGNTSLKVLHEEQRVLSEMIHYLQDELLRRNGLGMMPKSADGKSCLTANALSVIRPELAVLLQPDIFNTNIEAFFDEKSRVGGNLSGLRQELMKRKQISNIQKEIWQFLEEPLVEQVRSFFELALAIKVLRTEGKITWPKLNIVSRGQITRLGAEINRMLRNVADDSMRQFLISAVQYLIYLPETLEDIPEAVLIALRDVKKILGLEEQAISQLDQKYLNFMFLKIARIGGDSG